MSDELVRSIIDWAPRAEILQDYDEYGDAAFLGRAHPAGHVSNALWTKMAEIRKVYDQWIKSANPIVAEIEYEAPSVSRKQQYNIVDADGKFVRKGGTLSKAQKALKPGQSLVEGAIEEKVEGGPYLRLDPPFPLKMTPSKSYPSGVKHIGAISFFTWTSKMSCPSFSLPGGPAGKILGTCPAATREAVERTGEYLAVHEEIPKGTAYICDSCYTGKGNYTQYRLVSLGQLVRRAWILRELRKGVTSLARKLAEAVSSLIDPDVRAVLATLGVSVDYFRIHDAGDLLTPDYYFAWRAAAEQVPEVAFWCPTRQWVWRDWRERFANYPPPANMSLRPSALFFGARPPIVEGMDAGTTAAEGTTEPWYDFRDMRVWNCPAYAAEKPTCASGINPMGEVGCRACWIMKEQPVNYRAH